MNFSGRGNNNWKDLEARKSSTVLRSRQDGSMAKVERTRGPVGQDMVRGRGRDHILRVIVSQSRKLAFYSKHDPKSLPGFKLERDTV